MEKRMFWLGLIFMVVCLCASGAFAASMGPPVAGLDAGQFSVGVDYSMSEIDVEVSEKSTGSLDSVGPVYTGTLLIDDTDEFTMEIESDMILANLGYGITDKWEASVLLGMSDFSIAEADDLDGSDEFAYGFNVKTTFYEEGDLKLGAMLQMTWSESDASFIYAEYVPDIDDVVVADAAFDVDYYQLKIAVGPSYKVMEGVSVYGGPFYHMVDGDYDIELTNPTSPTHTLAGSAKLSGDIEEESNFGGYVGVQVGIAENLPIAAEYQFTGDAEVFAASLAYRF
jgi:opacity protein-like surface antigen